MSITLYLDSTSEINKNGIRERNKIIPLLPSNHDKGNWLETVCWKPDIWVRCKVLTEITLSPTHRTLSLCAAPPSAMREI